MNAKFIKYGPNIPPQNRSQSGQVHVQWRRTGCALNTESAVSIAVKIQAQQYSSIAREFSFNLFNQNHSFYTKALTLSSQSQTKLKSAFLLTPFITFFQDRFTEIGDRIHCIYSLKSSLRFDVPDCFSCVLDRHTINNEKML